MAEAALPEPNTRFLQPLRGVRDTSTAEAIEGVGNIVLEANKVRKGNAIEEELTSLTQDVLTTVDQEQVDEFGKQMSKLERLKKAGLSETQFRIRAESILKRHIASAPALAEDFRARAGRAVSGAAVTAAFDAAAEEQQANAKVEAAILSQASRWNMDIRDFGTPAFDARYNEVQTKIQRGKMMELQDKIDVREMPDVIAAEYFTLMSAMNEQSVNLLGSTIDKLTPLQIAQLPADKRVALIAALERHKNELPFAIANKYRGVSVDQAATHAKPIIDQINFMIDRIQPGEDSTRLKNVTDTYELLVKERFLQHPQGLRFAVLSGMSDTAISAEAASSASTFLLEMLTQDGGSGVEEANKPGVAKAASAYVTRWMSGVDTSVLDESELATARQFLGNFYQVATAGTLGPNAAHEILTTLDNPSAKKFLDQLPKGDDILIQGVKAARRYAVQSSIAAVKEIEREREFNGAFFPERFGAPKDIKQVLRPVVSGGVVTIQPASDDTFTKQFARTAQKNYANRINLAIRVISNMSGKSLEESAKMLFKASPDAFEWIEGGAEDDAS